MSRKAIGFLSVVAIILTTTIVFHLTQGDYITWHKGRRLFERRLYANALPYLEKSFEIDYNDSNVAFYLLIAYRNVNRVEESIQVLETILSRNPDDEKVAMALAGICYRTGDYLVAEHIYKDLIKQQGRTPFLLRNLGDVLTWQKKYDEALVLMEEICKENPEDYKTREKIADIHSWEARHDIAEINYRILLKAGYQKARVALKLAESLRYAGKDEEAIEVYKKYLSEQDE
jgi:tetratricopeptide (TPR) repeat protein